jgi:hypothetical protein
VVWSILSIDNLSPPLELIHDWPAGFDPLAISLMGRIILISGLVFLLLALGIVGFQPSSHPIRPVADHLNPPASHAETSDPPLTLKEVVLSDGAARPPLPQASTAPQSATFSPKQASTRSISRPTSFGVSSQSRAGSQDMRDGVMASPTPIPPTASLAIRLPGGMPTPSLSQELLSIEVPTGENLPLVLSEETIEDDFTPEEIVKNRALADQFLDEAKKTDAATDPVRWRRLVNHSDELFRTWYGTDAYLAMEARRYQESLADQSKTSP